MFTYTEVNNASKIYQNKEFFWLEVRGVLKVKMILNLYLFIFAAAPLFS